MENTVSFAEWAKKLIKPFSAAAGAAMATATITKTIASVAKMDEKSQKAFAKVFLRVSGVFLTCALIYKRTTSRSERKTLEVISKIDANNYASKRMTDAIVYRANAETDAIYGRNRKSDNNNQDESKEDPKKKKPWRFDEEMPELPPFLEKIMRVVPAGYEIAMLLHLFSMLGSMCFSKVRAKYLDNVIHAPNIQVIVEGAWGSGKGKLEQLYRWLFKRIIDSDIEKINSLGDGEIEEGTIIQTAGIGTSMARFTDILAVNQGVHFHTFISEIRALCDDMKKANGLSFDFLRKAFENGTISRNNRAKDSKNGIFPIFWNYTITGTPQDINTTFKKELEGGTLSRICWTCIPESGRDLPVLGEFKDNELASIRKQISEWQSRYCYKNEKGRDVAVPEHRIDLGYVCEALNEWLNEQYDQAEKDGNHARMDVRTRMATIAFHCAIVIHMLFGSKNDAATRQKVVNLTLYIANYCTERFLWKFGEEQNKLHKEYEQSEETEQETNNKKTQPQPATKKELITDVAELYRLHEILDEKGNPVNGWDTLAERSGWASSTVRDKVKKYAAKLETKGGDGVQ